MKIHKKSHTFKTTSVASILREKRNERALSIPQVAEATKIRRDFIAALEEGNYEIFPSPVYARGFLRNYAQFLGIDPEKINALYRRETAEAQKIAATKAPKKPIVNLNSQKFMLFSIFGLVLLFILIYIGSQVTALLQAPYLEITAPVSLKADYDGEIFVGGNSFKITGKAAAQSVIRINSQPVELKPGNEFETDEIPLKDSQLAVTITATNQFGRTSTINLSVKKGSTGIASAEKMSVLVEIESETVPLLIRADGIIQFNDRAFPGDIITVEANSRLQIETETPAFVIVTINGEEFRLSSGNQTWELIDGKVIQQ